MKTLVLPLLALLMLFVLLLTVLNEYHDARIDERKKLGHRPSLQPDLHRFYSLTLPFEGGDHLR